MRQAGQPVRGFKSLHLRAFFVKFFIIKMHNKLDNRCFYMYNCNSKRNFTSGFDRDWSNGMIGVSKTFGGSSILSSPALKNARKPCIYWVSGVFVLSRMIKSNHRSNQKILYESIILIHIVSFSGNLQYCQQIFLLNLLLFNLLFFFWVFSALLYAMA